MITYDNFLRQFALKPSQAFSAAPIVSLTDIMLPRGAVLHYVTDTAANFGIRGSNPLLIGEEERKIRIAFIRDGYGTHGRTKNRVFSADKAIKDFKLRQRRFTVQRDWSKAINSRDMVIMDYSALAMQQTYVQSMTQFHDEWMNMTEAMMNKVNQVNSDRPQFINVKLPSTWPSKAHFGKVEEKFSTEELGRWVQPGHFWMREIWRAIKGMSDILKLDERIVPNLSFIFSLNNHCMIMSLNDILSRAEEKNNVANEWHKAMTRLFQKGTGVDDSISEETTGADSELDDTPNEALQEPEPVTEEKQLVKGVPNTATVRIAELGQAGRLTAAEQNRLITIAQNAPLLVAPVSSGEPIKLGEFIDIKPEELKVTEELKTTVNDLTVPAHAKRSKTLNLTKEYIERDIITKDIASMIMHTANAGVFVQDFKVSPLVDALNKGRTFEIKNVPIQGKGSTWKIELPDIEPDGSFMADGVRYTMDFQRVDIPLRKTSPQRAALTSYYGKLFIQRAGVVKHDYSKWIRRKISDAALDAEDKRITNQQFGGNEIPRMALPREYTALMQGLTRFESNGFVFYLDHKNRESFFGSDAVKKYESKDEVIIAMSKSKKEGKHKYLTLNTQGFVNGDIVTPIKLLEFLGGGWGTPPRDVAEILIFGKRVPVGLVLAYYTGLNELIKLTKAKTRRIPANQRVSKSAMNEDEIYIKFNDEWLVVDGTDPVVSLIFSGFTASEKLISSYNLSDFNSKDVYGPLFMKLGAARHHLTELEILKELYIDPITRDLLKEMKLPTELVPLMIEAIFLIRNDDWSEETDPTMQRRRGYERIAGFVYKKLIEAIREQRNKPNPSNHAVYMGPRDVWAQLVADPTVQLVKDLNPIHFLKEQEAVNLSGDGGRKGETLVKKSRSFNAKDLGSISESTPDSGKVGIRTYLTANAKTAGIRGMWEEFDFERDGSTSVLSTTALTLPAMNHDDG
ncbi:RNA polymerase beta subunit [Vibrio phage BONAISHI]|nr:RNA polymerase beta subunit [Vibrio phage BONAISHI]